MSGTHACAHFGATQQHRIAARTRVPAERAPFARESRGSGLVPLAQQPSLRSPGTLARQPGAYEDSALKAPQHLDILLKGARGKLLALLHQGDATVGEIETAVAGMYDQAEVLEPIAGDAVGMNDVADIDQIGLEQLIERPGRVSSELQRRATS